MAFRLGIIYVSLIYCAFLNCVYCQSRFWHTGFISVFQDEQTGEIKRRLKPGRGAGQGVVGDMKLVQQIRVPKERVVSKAFDASKSVLDSKGEK